MNYLFPARISLSTTIGIVASVAAHGALFAFPNLPLFSVEKQQIKTTPIPVVKLNEAELARLPNLTPPPAQIPEFPNTPLSTTPMLQTAVQLPFTNITPPPPPLPNTSLFLPNDPADQFNVKPEQLDLPPVQELPPIQTTTPPPPPTPRNTEIGEQITPPPAISRRDDLEEIQRQLQAQRQIEREINIDPNSRPTRTTEDILRELSNPQISQNVPPENNNSTQTPANSATPRTWPGQLPPGEYPLSQEDQLTLARQNTRAEIQQRMEALKLDATNTSDQEATNNYLNWLISINQVQPEKITIKGQYPKDACLQKLEGSTTYGVMVNAQGEASNLRLIQSSGYPIFNQNARYEISFHDFAKNNPKPYLVKVDFTYNQNRCPEELPSGNQDNRRVLEITPSGSSSNNINNRVTKDEKPQSTPVTGENKPQSTPVTGENKPQSTPVTEKDKPQSTPVTGEDKPQSTPVTGEDKPQSTPVTEEDKPQSTPVTEEDKPQSTPVTEGETSDNEPE